jgi:4-hydroxybenzoate polyprenyltransferase
MNGIKSFIYAYRTTRSLKYGGYFITMIPFFAILMYNGFISSPWSLLYILPLVFAFAAGFMCNAVGDAAKDPKSKNPVTQGVISKKFLWVSIVVLSLVSLFFSVLIYSSSTPVALVLVLILLFLFYSNFSIRLKESLLGPAIASLGFFVIPSMVLLSEFNYFNLGTDLLLLGLFMIYFAHEIKHTIIEYDLDLSFDCRTFAVRTGKKTANMIEYVSLLVGFIFLLGSIYYLLPNSFMLPVYHLPVVYLLGVFVVFFGLTMFFTLLYGFRTNFDQEEDVIYNTLPYIATRTCYITIAMFLLSLPILVILFVVWILFTDKYL